MAVDFYANVATEPAEIRKRRVLTESEAHGLLKRYRERAMQMCYLALEQVSGIAASKGSRKKLASKCAEVMHRTLRNYAILQPETAESLPSVILAVPADDLFSEKQQYLWSLGMNKKMEWIQKELPFLITEHLVIRAMQNLRAREDKEITLALSWVCVVPIVLASMGKLPAKTSWVIDLRGAVLLNWNGYFWTMVTYIPSEKWDDRRERIWRKHLTTPSSISVFDDSGEELFWIEELQSPHT